jgi:hypothetical protein
MASDGAIPPPSAVPPAGPARSSGSVPPVGDVPPSGAVSPPSARAGERSPLTGDWPAQAADAVVDLVGAVRDRTLGPIMLVARALVYGILVMVLATVAVVLLVIALVRVTDWLVPGEVWSAYLVLGALFTAGGLVMWSLRRPRGS